MKIFNRRKKNNGVTIVELVVVLAIFAILSLVIIYNYGNFQSKIDIQDLTSGIALQVAQAQNSSLSGLTTAKTTTASPWKPTYGVYFSTTPTADINGADNKDFIYFVDLNNDNQFNGGAACDGAHECESKVTITKNNNISDIAISYISGSTTHPANATISFTRPSSGPTIYDGVTLVTSPLTTNLINYVHITVANQSGSVSSNIYLYPSGRIQIN